jgi:2-polyprenyl-6-methoxyphenol hydroxylase-like FAD-dependent oxidoreductase
MLVPGEVATGVEAWTPAGLFGAFAVDAGTYAFASCGTDECRAALEARDLDAFRATWGRAYAPSTRVLAGLEAFDELIQNEVVKVKCARWVDGSLILVGDAAHAMAPNLGQGANSALVDTATLCEELRRAPSLTAALAAWQNRRRPAVRRVARVSESLCQLAEVTNPGGRPHRDRVLCAVLALFSAERAVAPLIQVSPHSLRAIGQA